MPAAAPLPAPQAVAGPRFDPRFVQPATKLGLVGPTGDERQRLIREMEARSIAEKTEAIEWARRHGFPIRTTGPDGDSELMRLDENGNPQYLGTQNQEARISHNVDLLNGFFPDSIVKLRGNGWRAGVWDSGSPRLSHVDFNGLNSVTYLDNVANDMDFAVSFSDHATHVLGTFIGNGACTSGLFGSQNGTNQESRGMAPDAIGVTYGWNQDIAEMMAAGATAPNQPSRIYVSNHSYGFKTGWTFEQNPNRWRHWGDANSPEASGFGKYDNTGRSLDMACHRTPYLLPFFAAGNPRGLEPNAGSAIQWIISSPLGTPSLASGTWPRANVPPANGSQGGGYDTLGTNASAKNVMTVGNMLDAVVNGSRFTPGIGMVSSSGFGPTDDGRIKPDIVGNGNVVLSATQTSDTSAENFTGTSMASPGCAGVALLMHEHYRNSTGQYMRASTTKALLIHTATDVQTPGPDYQSGWGLVDGVAAYNHIAEHANNPGASHIVEGVLSGETRQFRITFTADNPIKATLVWTDPEGPAQTGLDNPTRVLVNDLDLALRLPDGSFRFPPSLSAADPTAAPVYSGNNTDPVEMIGGSSLDPVPVQAGLYELFITYKGNLVDPSNPAAPTQAFSLMISGQNPASAGTIADAVDQESRAFQTTLANAGFAWQPDAGSEDGDRAISLPITHDQTASFETYITGPATVTFNWGVSSEAAFDFLRFYSGDTRIAQISGTQATTQFVHNVPAGIHLLRWAYEKDSSSNNGDDRGWVDKIRFNNFSEGIDNFNYTWVDSPNSTVSWNTQDITADAIPTGDVGRAGAVNDSSGISAITTDITGPALVQFTMVQNAATGTLYAVWDTAIPGNIVVHNSGNAYRRYSVLLGPGSHDFHFVWTKPDATPGSGFVDDFVVSPLPGNGSLGEAADIPTGPGYVLGVEDSTQAAWVPDPLNGAPVGPGREPGPAAIRTVFIPTANFPNSTNNSAVVYTVRGPSLLSFWWQCTGSPDGSFRLDVDPIGSPVEYSNASPSSLGPRTLKPIPGGIGWRQVHLEVPPGLHNYRWAYTAAPADAPGGAWLDEISVQPGAMHPSRGLDHWSHPVEFHGDSPWLAVADESNTSDIPGETSIDSTTHGTIGALGSTTLTTTVTGPKKLFFDWKVSSEAGFDLLTFTLDGDPVVAPISGETEWTTESIDIPAGIHVLRWTYSKDGTDTAGSDRGWIDNLALLRPDFGMDLANAQPASGFVALNVRKGATGGYFIDFSENLLTWTSIPGDFAATRGMLDPSVTEATYIVAAGPGKRFYRLRYDPEFRHQLENHSFEQPEVLSGSFVNGPLPGWTIDGTDAQVFINRQAPAAALVSTMAHRREPSVHLRGASRHF